MDADVAERLSKGDLEGLAMVGRERLTLVLRDSAWPVAGSGWGLSRANQALDVAVSVDLLEVDEGALTH